MKTHGELNTERRNLASANIDTMEIADVLKTINKEDSKIIDAVKVAIPQIEETVNLTVRSIKTVAEFFM